MSYVLLIIALAICLSLAMSVAWAIASRGGKSGWIDAIWSFGVGATSVTAALVSFSNEDVTARQWLVASMCAIWSLRLGFHISYRTYRGDDDPRYAHLREQWGADFRQKLFWFLQLQAFMAIFLIISIMAAAHNPAHGLRLIDLLGVSVFLSSFIGESIADKQLQNFRAEESNKGLVCNIGLWGMTRHPNYFFEWLSWVSYALIAIDLTNAYPWGWVALTAPVLMYWLLVHVSGIPPLENHMLQSRGDKFRAYQAGVNRFWPGPKKRAHPSL